MTLLPLNTAPGTSLLKSGLFTLAQCVNFDYRKVSGAPPAHEQIQCGFEEDNDMRKIIGLTVLLIGLSGLGQSQCPTGVRSCGVPEIDPASGVSALALLSGAALVIRGRRKR